MPRLTLNLNRDWRFFRGECPAAADRSYDDTAWQRIGPPHCFDAPYFRTPEFYVGEGWYRRRLPDFRSLLIQRPLSEIRNLKTVIEFDGVFQACDVFVNGHRIGGHRGGYTGFCIDITDAVQPGENTIAVRVDNRWNAQLAPRAGEHIFSGGIYRDVRLVVTDGLHVPWCGQSIITPVVSRDRASVHVSTTLVNHSGRQANGELLTRIISPDGQVAHPLKTPFDIHDQTTAAISQQCDLSTPLLWHPDHPHLYRVETDVIVDGEPVDRVEHCFGIRSIKWTADRGFFLNGEHLYLRGANAHQDHAGWGIGITRAACERDVRLMKEAGLNFVRGAHYPHHPAFAAACDRLGMLFWSEATFWGKGGFGPEGFWNASAYPVNREDESGFEQSCLDQLDEMIRINRNHPSIIAWSMTNEAFFTYHLDRAKELMKTMVARSRALDPTRPAAIGGAQRGDIDRIGDIAGYNGDGARLFIDPGVPNMVSEYGAISKLPDAFDAFRGDLQPDPFPWRAGEAIWCGFDYGTIAGKQGLKGIVTHARVPKRSWHWYRQHNLGITPPPAPVALQPASSLTLRLDADKTTIRGTDATDDVQLTVTVVDEQDRQVDANVAVTLTIESGPGEFPTGRSITFDAASDIAIFHGEAAIAFRSYHGGRSVIRATSPGCATAVIEIETIGAPMFDATTTVLNDERPYVPPVESDAAKAALRNAVNIALNRPSRASSEWADAPARRANDGDSATAWLAADDDRAATWTLDLEGFYDLASIRLLFPAAGNWRFFVEVSLDRELWRPAINRRESINEAAARTDVFDPGLSARYMRLTFTNVPSERAGLAEVEVYGILSRQ